jgi:UDP-N-acetylmuramate dehydrogenase
MTAPWAERLETELGDRFDGRVERGRALARSTTYRLGGPAALYVEPTGVDDLEILGEALRALEGEDVPVLVLGRGSNVVISDHGWPGIVVRLDPGSFAGIEAVDDGLRAGGATSLPLLANWSARRGLSGLEFLIAVPGSVGGAVRMNAGAHGREVKDALTSATIFSLGSQALDVRTGADLGFAYRSSLLSDLEIVVNASFILEPADAEVVRARLEEHRRHRAATQPPALQNAGSTFKNPPGEHAGRLVEAAGLKGLRVGGAAVSGLHANFFVTDEGARSQDVYDLVQLVRARVLAASGIELEPEVRFVGAFEDPAATLEAIR